MKLSAPEKIDDVTRAAVRGLAARVEDEDGAPPLSDQALARLNDDGRHVLALDGGTLAGYAQLADGSLELVASADAIGPLLESFAGDTFAVWSHGAHSRLRPVLESRGFTAIRGLLQLRRPLGSVTPRAVPAGVRIEPFRVGTDEDAWVRVNAAAFATHPEQGRWTSSDVAAREAEPWFDANGFLLAWQGETLLGFHWTKTHSASLGEVYVLGIAPGEQGRGLGGVLLDHGLAYLHDSGCTEVLLYVEQDNAPARKLYESTGFTEYDRDTQYRSS